MKRKASIAVAMFALILILLPACGNSPDNELVVHKALTSFRAHEDGVHDHYYEIEKVLKDGEQAAAITRYQVLPPYSIRKPVWKTTLTSLQSKAHRVTGTLVHGDKLFFIGYYTLSMDSDLSDLALNSLANGFLIQVDRATGSILGIAAIRSQTEAAKSTVIPLSIEVEGEEIILTGKSSGGLAIGDTRLEPKSALDQFEIVIEPDSLEVLSASLTPLSSAPATFAAAQLPVVSKTSASAVLDFLGNFEANAVTQWAQSTILSKLGFPNAVQTQLGQIDSQLNTINTGISNIQAQLNTLLGDFYTLYNQELQNAIGSSDTLYTYFFNNMGTYFQGFRNAVNNAIAPGQTEQDLTIQMVAADTAAGGAVESFAAYFNGYGGTTAQVTMTQLVTNLNNLISTLYNTSTGAATGLLVSLNQQAEAQLQASNYGANAFDMVSTFDGYNESLMNIYSNLVQAIQMAYTIQATFIYLASTNPTYFPGWVIPISGVESSNSYQTNQGALNTYYEPLFQNAFNYVAQYLITDSYDTLTPASGALGQQPAITYQTGYTPMQADTLIGMPPNNQGSFINATPWTQACDIYVWSGVSTNAYESGAFGSNTITAQCNAGGTQQSVSQNLQYADQTSTPMNFYHGPGAGSNNVAWLQFQQWNAGYLQQQLNGTTFNMGGGIGYAYDAFYGVCFSHDDNPATINIANQGWNSFPLANSVYEIANSNFSISSGSYTIVACEYDSGWIIEGYISPLGLSIWFWIGASRCGYADNIPNQTWSYLFQVQNGVGCNSALVGQPVGSSYGYANVCMGGQLVKIYSNTNGTSVYLAPGGDC